MTEERLLLAVDLGTSHIKSAVYDAELNAVQASRIQTQDVSGHPEGELDAEKLWLALRTQIAFLTARVDPKRVAAIGIAGMAESGCLIDTDNKPVTPMLLWHDRRGIRQAAALRKQAGSTFARITGMRTTSVRSICKWKWMVDHGAPRDARWCGAPEWIALRLTGRWQTDPTLAVRTGAYDVLQGRYSSELLDLAGAPTALFPPAQASPAHAGTILPTVARELGLPGSTQVVIAGHDDIVSAYGAGALPGDLIDSGGTAEGLARIVETPPVPADVVKSRMAMTRYYRSGTWALIAGAGSTGALMKRVSEMLGQEAAVLDELASPAREYVAGVIDVRMSKEGFPAVTINPGAPAAEVWSAILDLVCERVARAASRLERLAGGPARLILVGGAAGSRELTARKSQRLRLPAVSRPEIDACTRGAAALAGLACGLVPEPP